ncbi:MAG TPA: hypothetical protein ENK48_08800 [Gammaproteobacteria bacterium]|nr:hypothetical protein [Gammaproteobacteria bacterium]
MMKSAASTGFAAAMAFLLAAMPAWGDAAKGKRWSVSPMLGVEGPRLHLLNDAEFDAPLPGQGRITLEATGDNLDFGFIVENRLDPINWGSTAGLEFQLLLDERYALLFGFGIWEGESTSSVRTEIPFQGVLTPTLYERTGKMSYFEYYLGVRRNFIARPGRYNVFGRLSLRELFDIDYREKFVFTFQGGPGESFKRLIVTDSQATGVTLLDIGLGAEYFLRDWISIGGDIAYGIGFTSFRLGNASKQDNIQPNDNIQFKLPAILDAQGKLKYLHDPAPFSDDPSYESVNYRPLRLEFDGWRALLRVNLYF